MDAVTVELEFTPNPETLKYVTNRTLMAAGAANYTSPAAAQGKSPLAERLFEEKTVSAVMIGKNFVTLTVKDQSDLQNLNTSITDKIKLFLESGAAPVIATSIVEPQAIGEIEQKIVEILDREIRPAVAMDGGDIAFEKYEDGFVYLRMQGSCAGCPSSMMTLKMGVENRLKEAIPEIQEVIPV